MQVGAGFRARRILGVGLVGLACGVLPACQSTDGEEFGPPGNLQLSDRNNYASDSSLSIPSFDTAPEEDLEICWDGVTSDIQCHDVASAELISLSLLRFLNLSQAEVEQRLTQGQVEQREIAGYVELRLQEGETCGRLSDLSFNGTQIELEQEYIASDELTYLLLLTDDERIGVGARAMAFLNPSSASTNNTVEFPSACGILDFSATLTELEPLVVPREGPWVVDWRNVTKDSIGGDIVYEYIDRMMLAFYEGLSVEQLQERILDLEQIATSLWEVDLPVTRSADLEDLRDRETGNRFSGFDNADGVWALALLCTTCQNPAPLLLTLIEPEGS